MRVQIDKLAARLGTAPTEAAVHAALGEVSEEDHQSGVAHAPQKVSS